MSMGWSKTLTRRRFLGRSVQIGVGAYMSCLLYTSELVLLRLHRRPRTRPKALGASVATPVRGAAMTTE